MYTELKEGLHKGVLNGWYYYQTTQDFEYMSPCLLINIKYYTWTFGTFMLKFNVIYSKTSETNQVF